MDGNLAQMVFTDPPYNVRVDGHVSGLGGTKHREFAMASGEMNPDEFERFLTTTFANLAHRSADGAICFVCMDWRHLREVVSAADGIFTEVKNLCVWAKTNGGMGTTLVAAERTGRRGHAIELDPHYCDVIVRRLEKVAGVLARLAGTDTSFHEVTVERNDEPSTEEGN